MALASTKRQTSILTYSLKIVCMYVRFMYKNILFNKTTYELWNRLEGLVFAKAYTLHLHISETVSDNLSTNLGWRYGGVEITSGFSTFL